jgi:polyisoprenoid-binding protein YceI
VVVTVDPTSFDSAFEPADNQVRNNFLEVMTFPEIRFVSTSITRGEDNRGAMTGQVLLMGVTRELTFDVNYHGFNSARRITAGFGATTTVYISDFGPAGEFFRDDHNLANEVHLTIDAIFDRME